MKIVHISPVFQTKDQYNFFGLVNGGGGRYVSELALSISRRHDTTLITFGESDFEFRHETLKIRIIKCAPFLRKFNGDADFLCFRLFRLLRDFDVIHAHQYYADTTLFACLFGLLAGKKVFVTDHGFRGVNLSRYIPMKYLCRKVLAETAYEKYVFRLKDSQYDVIYGGVDLARYVYSEAKTRQVIFIGRLLPHKGVNYLLKALDPDVDCIIAGYKQDDRFFRLLQDIARTKRVKFLLSASDQEVVSRLRESSVLVLPSVDIDVYGGRHKNTELFGLVIAEAFACGTPVIVTDSSALPYVVNDGVDGFVVPQNNVVAIKEKITYLLANPEAARAMGRRGRIKAEQIYNWDIIAERCLVNYFS